MTAITYTAKRNLVSGHTVDTQYLIDQAMAVINGPGGSPRKRERMALDGTTQTLIHRLDQTWQFRTSEMEDDELGVFLEFLDSVSGGESFTVDPYGTVASPVNVQTAILVSRDESPSRIAETEYRQIGFKVRILP